MGGLRTVIRYITTGASSPTDKTEADGALDQPGTPAEPVMAHLMTDVPWTEAFETPDASTGLVSSPNPSLPVPDEGKASIVGAYEGAFATRGPTSVGLGYEMSGGPYGNQALGRRMMFKLPLTMSTQSFPGEGKVTDAAWADELAAAIANNGQGQVTDAEVTTSLVLWQ